VAQTEVHIHGYAIVSDDDGIADSTGQTPASLRNEADWAYFQRELDLADFVAIGRLGHEANPNIKGRRRLVLSSAARGLEQRSDAWWWNPAQASWRETAETLLPEGGRIAVPGGQAVFDLFLRQGYDGFHLSRAHGVRLPAGRRLFAACESGQSAESVLRGAGLIAGPTQAIDAGAGVTLTLWRQG
jgi:dihydrofolate reductase